MSRLRGRADNTAVVIGGTHGEGLALVRALLDEGATVLLTGYDECRLEAARTELRGLDARAVRLDATSMADIEALAELAAGTLGRVKRVFVNHGHYGTGECAELTEVTEKSWDRHFAVNTKGAFFLARALVPLIDPGGSITFTTGGSALPGTGPCHASKAAVRAFAGVLAAELSPRRVSVRTVAAGSLLALSGG